MKALILGAFAVFGMFSAGCYGEAKLKKELPTTQAPESNSNDDNEGSAIKGEDDEEDCAFCRKEETSELPGSPATPGATPENPKPPATTAADKKVDCRGTSGSHNSVTTITYTVTNDVVKIKTFNVVVTNADGNNDNDVDVYITPKGGSESKAFNSGDVLANKKSVNLTQGPGIAAKTGAKIRILTNFDRTALTDPTGECSLTL